MLVEAGERFVRGELELVSKKEGKRRKFKLAGRPVVLKRRIRVIHT
jgi:hypothetical protein